MRRAERGGDELPIRSTGRCRQVRSGYMRRGGGWNSWEGAMNWSERGCGRYIIKSVFYSSFHPICGLRKKSVEVA